MGMELEESYIARLREELADVAIKLNKLNQFIYTNSAGEVSPSERELLIIQKEAMETYEAILALRLSRVTEINREMAR